MLTKLQVQMLQAAAQNNQIAQILAIAVLMQDIDTVLYIAQHYNTAQHIKFAEDRATLTAILHDELLAQANTQRAN